MADILKQNQGNKILRQNQGGKILKANYNFGKAFKTGSGYTYIKIQIPASLFSTVVLLNWIQVLSNRLFQFYYVYDSSGNYMGHNNYIGGVPRHQYNSTTGNTYNSSALLSEGYYLKYSRIHTNSHDQKSSNDNFINYTPFTPAGFVSPSSIVEIRLFVTSQTSEHRVGETRILNRDVGDEELRYVYNMGLGNDLLRHDNVCVWYRYDKAEILDFSSAQDGSDMRVGVRNYGSIVNGHGEIIGLPAGTLEEKVAWANANLFVNFL